MSIEVYLIFKKFHITKFELYLMLKDGVMSQEDYDYIIENNLIEV